MRARARESADAILRLLSLDPRCCEVRWSWGPDEPRLFRGGRRRLERQLRAPAARRAGGAPECAVQRAAPPEGGRLEVRLAGSATFDPAELHALALALAGLRSAVLLEGRARPPRSEDAQRLHDVAHLVTHALLALPEGGDELAAARASLTACRDLAGTDPGASPRAGPRPRTALAGLIEAEVQRALSAQRSGARVRIRMRVAPDVATRADPQLLGRIVRNLLLNAIEASPDRAEVRVRAWRERDGETRLEIRDQGRGLPRAACEHLYATEGVHARGSGLGQWSVRDCARRLAARIEVEGAPGRGLCVTVRWSEPPEAPAVALIAEVPSTWARLAARLRARGLHVLDHAASAALLRAGDVSSVDGWVVARGSAAMAAGPWSRLSGTAAQVEGVRAPALPTACEEGALPRSGGAARARAGADPARART